MKKKIYGVLVTLVFVGLMAGCGKSDNSGEGEEAENSAAVREEIVSFVNDDIAAIQSDRNDAIGIYNSYFAEDKVDLEQFKSDLRDTAIPKMETYINNLSAIETEAEEVSELKELYYLGAEKQYEAMVMVSSALDSQNPEFLTQANSLIAESESYITQYESQLRLLSVDYDIDINGSLTSSAKQSEVDTAEDADTAE